MLGGIDLVNKNHFFIIISISILLSSFSLTTVNATSVLEIIGPIEVFEGEYVEFIVTLDGQPIQARVTIGDSILVNWTNSSTGSVIFTMPSVPSEDEEFLVSASIPGDLTASYFILVKNKTGFLEIEFSGDYAIEMNEFNVSIQCRDKPVEGANVWFNSNKYITNSFGNITLFAPDVLVTTNYGVSVNKTGYKTNSTSLTVVESDLGLNLMEVIYPFIVEPGEENITIKVIDKYGGLENTTIEVYYENIKQDEYATDSNGIAFIKAPLINYEYIFTLKVYKSQYKTYTDEEIKINLFALDLNFNLELSVNPSEVYEGDIVTIKVIDELGYGINEAEIWRGSKKIEKLTDENGILELNAPSVFFDREYFIYAIKQGYNFAEGKITVRKQDSIQENIIMDVKNYVNESEVFYVTLKDEKSILLDGVTVLFNSVEKVTSTNGIVYFTAPNITKNTFYSILSNKYGYSPASASIEVINIDGANGDSNQALKICITPYVMENEDFSVTIRNEQGDLISGAKVTFMDTSKNTDYKGSVTFKAPDVAWDGIQEILATKSNYESSSSEIIIKNKEEFQYWFLLIIVVIIVVIGFIAFFKNRKII